MENIVDLFANSYIVASILILEVCSGFALSCNENG